MDKSHLRTTVRQRRAEMSATARAAAAQRATRRLLALPEMTAAGRVLLYASHGDELSTDELRAALVERGATVLLPRVAGDELELVVVDADAPLRPGFRGVREPAGEAHVSDEPDVAVVPGLAFDHGGGRLGQGGGHYDRLLRRLPPAALRVGLGFAVQVVDHVPRESHDEPIDVLVTEDAVVRTGAR